MINQITNLALTLESVQTITPPPAGSLETLVGNTPLVPLRRVTEGISPRVQVLAKAEWFNPGGSIKDRPALNILRTALADGSLTSGKRLLDSTSGNMGIAYATFGAALGVAVTLVMPANASHERKDILAAYGAELVLTDPLEGIDESIRTANRLREEKPHLYFRPDQYNNPVNWQAHFHTTGVEIWEQTGGAVTHLVAGIGTSGTLMGTGRRLKGFNPDVEVVAVEPAESLAIIEGLKHMETSLVPAIYDPTFPDRSIPVYPDAAHDMARRLALEEGLFVGYSAGAAAWASLELAKTIKRDSVIVTVFPDGGEKYLSVGR